MALFRRRLPKISRDAAMSARPRAMPIMKREERDGGGVLITLMAPKPRWMRLVSSGGRMERTFGLDHLGVEVYDACDGRTPVRKIVKDFAKVHALSIGEAEHAVATFLRTLIGKGLVVMEIPKSKL